MSKPHVSETPFGWTPGLRFELVPASAVLRVALEILAPRGGQTTGRLAWWQPRSDLHRATP